MKPELVIIGGTRRFQLPGRLQREDKVPFYDAAWENDRSTQDRDLAELVQ
jgi:hypothetical protein